MSENPKARQRVCLDCGSKPKDGMQKHEGPAPYDFSCKDCGDEVRVGRPFVLLTPVESK